MKTSAHQMASIAGRTAEGLLSILTTLCSAGLEVLVPTGRMFIPIDVTIIPLN